MIECQKCKKRYIGESERPLKERISEHKGYIRNNHTDKATGKHFNEKGHNLEDMMVCTGDISMEVFTRPPAICVDTGVAD